MVRLGLAAGFSVLSAAAALAEGMQAQTEQVPQVVLEQTAGGFTSGLVIVLVMLGLISLMGVGKGEPTDGDMDPNN